MMIDETMKADALAELRSYRRLIYTARRRAMEEEAKLHGQHLSREEQRIRAGIIWARFTLATAELELASLVIERRLADVERMKPILMDMQWS